MPADSDHLIVVRHGEDYFDFVREQAEEDDWTLGAARWRAVGCRCISSGDGVSQRTLANCPFHGRWAPPRPKFFATFDPGTDIFYLPIAEPLGLIYSVETTWGALVDYDEAGDVVGIELWSASEKLPGALLSLLPEPTP